MAGVAWSKAIVRHASCSVFQKVQSFRCFAKLIDKPKKVATNEKARMCSRKNMLNITPPCNDAFRGDK